MALVGHISGSSQSNSVIGISGSVIVSNRPNSLFPSLPGSDVTFFVSGALDNTAVSVFGGKLVVSGGINSTTISGSGNFNVGGDLRIAGDLRVDGNDVKSSTGATVIAFTGSNVVIPGDLTVNGTTVTVSSSNLVIFDQLIGIGFESGSISRVNGDRGLIGGLATGDNASVFWDNSESEFAVVRTNSTPESSSVNVVSYAQLHVSTLTGSLVKSNALTGSLTKLVDGSDYLRAGTNISLTTGSSGEVTVAVSGLGGGDVFGPASATNDAIAVYDGTTGKLIKNSGLSVGSGTSTQAYVTASVNLTNRGFALIPNGTGSLSAQAPDGTTSGGNSRGAYSTDWQRVRSSATQVASGEYSSIGGGSGNTASGNFSTVVGGIDNSSTGYSAGSGGISNTSTNSGSFALGISNTSSSTGSMALGGSNIASGDYSVAMGLGNIASGSYSVAMGNGNNVTNLWSSAIGRGNIVSELQSSAIGTDNNISNSNSIGLGLRNTVNGGASVAIGTDNSTSGIYAFAVGLLNTASADYSYALGTNSRSDARFSFAIGQQVTASSFTETVTGQYNRTVSGNTTSFVSTDRLFIVGNGIDSANRSDALQLFKDGNLHISGTLTIMSGATSGVTFPTVRGNNGEVLTSNGAGLITWALPTGFAEYFYSTTTGSIYTTGSAAFRGDESIDSPSDKGSDVFFYVSGSTDGASMALFGGCITASGSLKVDGDVVLGNSSANVITFNGQAGTDLLPSDDMLYNLGSPSNRWANVYTGDLHLRNDRGDWTVIEEDEYLSIRNNKTGKMFKFVLEPV
jgi:hypothetical protein